MNAQQATLLGLGCPDRACGCTAPMQGLGLIDTPNDDWNCFQWVDWHKQLVKNYRDGGSTEEQAQRYAKTIFLTWWDQINTFYGSLNWCGYNPEFFNYFKSVGITEHISFLASVSAPIISATANVADSAGSILTDAGKVGENAAGAAGKTSKVLQVLIPVALVALASGAGYYVYKHYLKGNEKIKVPRPSLKGPEKSTSKKVIHI